MYIYVYVHRCRYVYTVVAETSSGLRAGLRGNACGPPLVVSEAVLALSFFYDIGD